MKIFRSLIFMFSIAGLLLVVLPVQARTLADVQLEEQLSLQGVDRPLLLNGAGIRYKFIFKIYIAALYLPQKEQSAEAILKTPQANRIVMHFLYDEVTKEKLTSAWVEGFADNTDAQTFSKLKTRLDTFTKVFSDLHAGDIVLLDYVPGKGTQVNIKGEDKLVIEGEDFNRALLAVWLGENPVTEALKEALTGYEE